MRVGGLAAGLTYGVDAGDVGGKLATVVGNAAVQLPPPGCSPQSRSLCWPSHRGSCRWRGRAGRIYCGVPAGFVCSGLPQWLLDLEPFGHILGGRRR
jgi:ABC-2 type transport system permease protein